jgi:hypothetical protein
MLKELRMHTFPNGDILTIDAANTFVGLHGLTVYTVLYGSKDGDEFQAIGSEPFMSKEAANAAFEKRIASTTPAEPTSPHNDIYNLVVQTFERYLGEHSLRQIEPPKDWEDFYKYVKLMTFGGGYGEFEEARSALHDLTNTSAKDTNGRSDIKVELPAWKVLEMLTAITALGMAMRQHKETQLRVAA